MISAAICRITSRHCFAHLLRRCDDELQVRQPRGHRMIPPLVNAHEQRGQVHRLRYLTTVQTRSVQIVVYP